MEVMDRKVLEKMSIHETMDIYSDNKIDLKIIRVVRGWIYYAFIQNDSGDYSMTSTFVPNG